MRRIKEVEKEKKNKRGKEKRGRKEIEGEEK